MQNEEEFFEDRGESKTAFNSSIDIIQRISKFEYSLSSCLLFEDYKTSFKFLRLIYSEIDFKLKPEEVLEIDEFIMGLKMDMPKALELFQHEGSTFIKHPQLRMDFQERLFQLKRILNQLKYKAGLGMLDQSDPRFALLNG